MKKKSWWTEEDEEEFGQKVIIPNIHAYLNFPKWILLDERLSSSEFKLLQSLSVFYYPGKKNKRKDGKIIVFPSRETLGRMLGVEPGRITQLADRLVKIGYINVIGGSGFRSNKYELLFLSYSATDLASPKILQALNNVPEEDVTEEKRNNKNVVSDKTKQQKSGFETTLINGEEIKENKDKDIREEARKGISSSTVSEKESLSERRQPCSLCGRLLPISFEGKCPGKDRDGNDCAAIWIIQRIKSKEKDSGETTAQIK